MKIPEIFKGMKLVKCYKYYALYENKYYRECFQYTDLIKQEGQKTTKDIKINNHF